jgi:hypothetical protein
MEGDVIGVDKGFSPTFLAAITAWGFAIPSNG